LEKGLAELKKSSTDIKKQMEESNALFGNMPSSGSGGQVDDHIVNGIIADLRAFKHEMYRFKDETSGSLKQISDSLQ